jgi:hypothetical protein
MLERLYAALSAGPALNCRPHNSRQRFDLSQVQRLDGVPAHEIIGSILADEPVTIKPTLSQPSGVRPKKEDVEGDTAGKARWEAWDVQQAVLTKLKIIAEDARTYEQETGAQVLYIGYPIVNLPPTSNSTGRTKKRIIAPVAFIPVSLTVKTGRAQSVTLEAIGEGRDKVVANTALFAWLEQQTGTKFPDIDPDEHGENCWKELNDLTAAAAKALQIAPVDCKPELPLAPIPKSDDEERSTAAVLPAAIIGLFPMSNLGLIRDTEAMLEGEPLQGTVPSFLRLDAAVLDGEVSPQAAEVEATTTVSGVGIKDEFLVSNADPCQTRAVRLARKAKALVVHGPPGTGKSQTITNIIGDHLARGERVLFVSDKRTALDVVWHRLEHLGLGALSAVVYDAQRDQRDLYMGVREQLEELADKVLNAQSRGQLESVSKELKQVHGEMLAVYQSFQSPQKNGQSFHNMVGRWMELDAQGHDEGLDLSGTRAEEIASRTRDLKLALDRAASVHYGTNPWRDAVTIDLAAFLAAPIQQWRASFEQIAGLARQVEETRSSLELSIDISFGEGSTILSRLAKRAAADLKVADGALALWTPKQTHEITAARNTFAALKAHMDLLRSGSLDPELTLALPAATIPDAELNRWISHLASYLRIAGAWYAFLFFKRKSQAEKVVSRVGWETSKENAERIHAYLCRIRARRLLTAAGTQLGIEMPDAASESEFMGIAESHATAVALLHDVYAEPALANCLTNLVGKLGSDKRDGCPRDLETASLRAKSIAELQDAVADSKLIAPKAFGPLLAKAAAGAQIQADMNEFSERFPDLESLLRLKTELATLPTNVAPCVAKLAADAVPSELGLVALERAALHGEIRHTIASDPTLSRVDIQHFNSLEERYTFLEAQKRMLAREAILAYWLGQQKEHLLAMTGSRLNSEGAELKRRLTLRGEKAMKIRQVIAAGQQEGKADPLFDVKPLWMASPQTVAQIFPRKPLFDVIIFDEASQCRLEEAVPVLARAKRVVIAGDPKQLPPTRFFEGAVAASQDEDANTDQELFEQQQSAVEDLLSAALNLEVDQSYLDVHYRSHNSDLISFSNEQFYNKRLQPIPAHPRNRAKFPPITLVRAHGMYEKRVNEAEAREVLRIVRKLLNMEEVPSIGIACFNLSQRDLILETLEGAAAGDSRFAEQFAAARQRSGRDSFEGLFVKNLENVQGDERDHIIISTTYGPDSRGKFYRRFGPLGQVGGGRRLNVLVTRARQRVHLVTSIPREVYTALPPVAAGQIPGGGWLLFSYLHYAELLEMTYQEAEKAASEVAEPVPQDVIVQETQTPSKMAVALGNAISHERKNGSVVHWGNEGFCVDVALRHPTKLTDVTAGVLCDLTRYQKTEDPIEWEVFRTAVLKSQGWGLVRAFSAQTFRDTDAVLREIDRVVQVELALAAKAHQA